MSALDPKEAEAAEGLLTVLAEHLDYLKRKARPAWLDDLPSKNQVFIYVPDDTGDIVLAQDAAFVCENLVLLAPGVLQDLGGGGFSVPLDTTPARSFLAISIAEASTGRNITESVFKTDVQRPAPSVQTINLETQGSNLFPTWALTPLNGAQAGYSGGFYRLMNTDAYQLLSAQWLLPRGAVVRSRYLDKFNTTDSSLQGYNDRPYLIMVGRKVYG